MFDFNDPCESCSQPLDSPACEHCPYSEEFWAVVSDPAVFGISIE